MNTSTVQSVKINQYHDGKSQINMFQNTRTNSRNQANTSNIQFIGKQVKSTGIKGIDQLILRHSICLASKEDQLADSVFQKSLILYGQDQRLDFFNLPPCMYMIIAAAKVDTKFVVHRFYLPYKNGVRFATYLLNEQGEIIESVSYQRNIKYLHAFKVIRKQIALASSSQQILAA